ncbi:hypothetical protein [Paraburkholderia tuberum]|uniref:RecT family protein n=1 Tax=Paraburkholderia tuberum TaxID=157910 RepID=A0A1H1GUH5_9BURK|nr:hypothetical protein [Paraburkholderia tuberum]SDR16872.1 hypothetical protein SAMN05445850_3095 [Paraburkholderia tuberum]
MSTPTTVENLRNPAPREANLPAVEMGFGTLQSFELMQRAAKLLTNSTLVPVAYRAQTEVKEYGKVTGYEDNPNGLSNCVVALNMAQRMGADPLMVMQNLYIVEGRPSWSSQFIIAAINSCGKYSPLRFDLSPATDPEEVTYNATEWQDQPNGRAKKVSVPRKVTVRHQTCVAWAIEKQTGERLESPTISIQMAIDEGWLTKNGSKWMTMPEVMLRYRSAAFFGKLYAPELLMGLQTAEEVTDIVDVHADGSYTVNRTTVDDLRAGPAPAAEVVPATQTSAQPTSPAAQRREPAPANEAKQEQTVASTAQVSAQQKSDSQQDDFAFDESGLIQGIREDLETANSPEEIDLARSAISGVSDEAAKAELNALASRRVRELSGAQESQSQSRQRQATTPPQRRPRGPISAE